MGRLGKAGSHVNSIRILAVLVTLLMSVAVAQEPRTVRIGLQASGTFSWVVFAMEYFGIDEELGITLESETYATKQATEIALRGGEADIVVDDFVGAAQMRSRGVPVRGVYPFSRATGGIVVPTGAGVESIADLEGLTIGAASLDDKSLLILRALALSQYDFDPQVDSNVIAVSPPLMEELLGSGELEAAIPYWHFVPRMTAGGNYRDLMQVSEMLSELGLSNDLPLLIVIARDGMDPELLRTFLRGFEQTIARMQEDDEVWNAILDNELYSLEDPSLFPSVRERWENGLPQAWDEETIAGLVALTEDLVEVAGAEVVGVETIDPEAYTTEFAPTPAAAQRKPLEAASAK